MIVRIVGGLGNQLFQYAIARTLCESSPQDLYFDLDCETGTTKRKFELDKFNITEYKLISNICSMKYRMIRGINNPLLSSSFGYVTEKEEFVIQEMQNYKYLDGYWQNELYFKRIKEILLSEIKYNGALDDSKKLLLNNIKDINSVGVHIRRGDYLSLDVYEILTLDYYYKSINMINDKIDNPHFYFFSDDIEWCKKNFNYLNNARFVEGNSAVEDFMLLNNCKHKIISNSTFSWWAAWLDNSLDHIIIAPSKWYADSIINDKCNKALLNDFITV